jgi:low temperature requirement protein LtrA
VSQRHDDVKRVSFVELYFDLIFVFAARQTAHVMIEDPTWRAVVWSLGLFVPLWWTWIGFVMLYNLRGEDQTTHRLIVLAGTLPCAVAAIEVYGASGGNTAGFALALAGARAILTFAFAFTSDQRRRVARLISLAYGISTVLFLVSAALPAPWRYVFWGLALAQEAGLLLREAQQRSRARRQAGREVTREQALEHAFTEPGGSALQVNSHHLAERFGLFMIILLGEIVVSVGSAAIQVHEPSVRYWVGLFSGLVLAAALWWIYFTSAAEINQYMLHASGGNPAMAYGLYAAGHLPPAFALLVVAAGMGLTLEPDPPHGAAWFVAAGVATFLAGTRAVSMVGTVHLGRLLRPLVVAATVCLALFQNVIGATGVLLMTTLWTVAVAVVVSSQHRFVLGQVIADPLHFFRRD